MACFNIQRVGLDGLDIRALGVYTTDLVALFISGRNPQGFHIVLEQFCHIDKCCRRKAVPAIGRYGETGNDGFEIGVFDGLMNGEAVCCNIFIGNDAQQQLLPLFDPSYNLCVLLSASKA